jgi:leucyl aminopeptidase (aminopeptidase T)
MAERRNGDERRITGQDLRNLAVSIQTHHGSPTGKTARAGERQDIPNGEVFVARGCDR